MAVHLILVQIFKLKKIKPIIPVNQKLKTSKSAQEHCSVLKDGIVIVIQISDFLGVKKMIDHTLILWLASKNCHIKLWSKLSNKDILLLDIPFRKTRILLLSKTTVVEQLFKQPNVFRNTIIVSERTQQQPTLQK